MPILAARRLIYGRPATACRKIMGGGRGGNLLSEHGVRWECGGAFVRRCALLRAGVCEVREFATVCRNEHPAGQGRIVGSLDILSHRRQFQDLLLRPRSKAFITVQERSSRPRDVRIDLSSIGLIQVAGKQPFRLQERLLESFLFLLHALSIPFHACA